MSNFHKSLPVCHAGLVQRHEINLARGSALCWAEEDLVISLAQELQLLSFLVHEDSVEMSGFDWPDLDGLVSPAHNLPSAYVRNRSWQLSPLQNDVLGDLAVSVDVDSLVVVAEKELHAVGVR